MDVMLDIETLATSQRAVVLSVGALQFELYHEGPVIERKPLFYVLNIPQQIAMGREVDMQTVRWWQGQSDKARAHWLETSPFSVAGVLHQLKYFCEGYERVWANGSVFDCGILSSLTDDFGGGDLWKYNAPRDLRVIRDFPARRIAKSPPLIFNEEPHHPLADCESQIHTLWAHWPEDLPQAPPAETPMPLAPPLTPPPEINALADLASRAGRPHDGRDYTSSERSQPGKHTPSRFGRALDRPLTDAEIQHQLDESY